jgi:hypothetical protein
MTLNQQRKNHQICPLQRLLTTILWCAQSPADGANRENAIRLAVNANNHPANEYLGRILLQTAIMALKTLFYTA